MIYLQLLSAAGCVSNGLVQELKSTFPVCFIDTVKEQHNIDCCSEFSVLLLY